MKMKEIDYISLSDIEDILYKGEEISFASNVWDRINRSYDFLKSFSVDRIIYGIICTGTLAQISIFPGVGIFRGRNILAVGIL